MENYPPSASKQEDEPDDETFLNGIECDFFLESEEMKFKKKVADDFNTNRRASQWRISSTIQNTNETSNHVFDLVCGKKIVLHLYPELGQQYRAWDCSLLISRYLEKFQQELCMDKRVLELGCGVGLPGLCAGMLGASEVTLTDMASARSVVEENIKLNCLQHRVKFHPLHWDKPEEAMQLSFPFDLIICSDLIYADQQSVLMLVNRLADCAAFGTHILSFHEKRLGASAVDFFREQLLLIGFNWVEIQLPEINASWLHDESVQMLKIQRTQF